MRLSQGGRSWADHQHPGGANDTWQPPIAGRAPLPGGSWRAVLQQPPKHVPCTAFVHATAHPVCGCVVCSTAPFTCKCDVQARCLARHALSRLTATSHHHPAYTLPNFCFQRQAAWIGCKEQLYMAPGCSLSHATNTSQLYADWTNFNNNMSHRSTLREGEAAPHSLSRAHMVHQQRCQQLLHVPVNPTNADQHHQADPQHPPDGLSGPATESKYPTQTTWVVRQLVLPTLNNTPAPM